MPGGPTTVTRCGLRSSAARLQTERSSSSSRSRPTSGAVPSGRSAGAADALGVVTVRDRSAEDRHHCVADELLEHASVLLDAVLGLAVVDLEHVAHVFGVRPVRACRRADEVDEEHGNELALLLRRCCLAERSAAAAA